MSVEWRAMQLGDVCQLKYGKSLPKAKRSGNGFGVFGSNGQVGLHDEALTDGTTIVVGRKGSFGEVTYSRERCWPIDTTYYVDDSVTDADLRWLYYRMKAMPLTQLNRAAAVPGLNRDDAYAQRLLLPPIGEQRRIAAVLDAAERLRAKRRRSLAKLDTLHRSLFVNMFGDGQAWPLNPNSRSLAEIESDGLIEIGRGQVISRMDIEAEPGDFPIYSSAALNNGEFGRYARFMFDEEMVTWSVDGGGHLFYRPRHKFSVTNVGGWIRVLRPDRLSARFLHAALALLHSRMTFDWSQKAHSSVIKRVYTSVLLPSFETQMDYQWRCEEIETTSVLLRDQERYLDTLFASLQQRAFRGEL